MPYIDLTMVLTSDLPIYPGDPVIDITPVACLADDGFRNYRLTTGMHAGTHIDGPLHFNQTGLSIAELNVENLIGEAVVFDVRDCDKIELNHQIKNVDIKNKIVLFCSGYYLKTLLQNEQTSHPVLTIEMAHYLVAQKVKMVAIDFPSPDNTPYPIHAILLKNNILIAENLTNTISLLDYNNIEIMAFPLKTNTDSAPARIIAKVWH